MLTVVDPHHKRSQDCITFVAPAFLLYDVALEIYCILLNSNNTAATEAFSGPIKYHGFEIDTGRYCVAVITKIEETRGR